MRPPHSTGGAMVAADAFSRLVARLRSGEDAVAGGVFERFAGRLVALARGRSNRLLGPQGGPGGRGAVGLQGPLRAPPGGRLDVGDYGGLWNLLTLITLRECADRAV